MKKIGSRVKGQGENKIRNPGPWLLLSKYIATLGFIGFIPYAPGTFGSAAGLLFVISIKPDDAQLLIFSAATFFIGLLTSHQAEKLLGKDSGHIVIDELCGYLISVIFIPRSAGYFIAAFVLFRIFDILKPPPVRNVERAVPGGAGVMLDDVLAGVYTNVCLQLWRYSL
ncbi:MAG: phosphatidylglycerophosphatase A [Nitrospiraceae bacterium]|nr:MAG: phosphatidylglycerophosphatase A [Nitrospiraceae bacterium]